MRGASILPIAALAALPCANAITLHKRDVPAVVDIPISRTERSQLSKKRSSKVVSTELSNETNMFYTMNITIGTPAQKVALLIDTGSSDIWVNIPNSTYCEDEDNLCSSYGTFNAKKSSTLKVLDYDMNATYASGFGAAGPYVTDTLEIGGATIKSAEFALGEKTESPYGILGIGYSSSTYAAGNLDKEYTNLPEALVKNGDIKSTAYSLWLNQFDGTGNILFGGVNKARYQGELQTVPVLPLQGEYRSLAIALTDISMKTSKGTKSYSTGLPLAVSLDSGSAVMALPKELVDPIYKEVGGGYSSSAGFGYIPCSMAKADYNVTFSFSDATITIPISQLVYENYVGEGFAEGDCIFGIAESEAGVNLMGDSFLRGAYVVYDLDNNEISLANANYDGGDDDILEIGTGTAAVPGATLMPSPVTSATGNGADEATGTAALKSSGSVIVETTMQVTATATGTGTGTGTGTAESGGATSTSSEGMAALPTSKPNQLLSGVLGAGLLLVL